MKTLAVIGGGPAGLRAAEVAAAAGVRVIVFEAKASVGRKFLVAGRGGLNLTKAEPVECFLDSYRGPGLPRETWRRLLADFPPEALRAWAAGFGVETFVASTGRVYPKEMKAAPLLRHWVQALKASGVRFVMRHRWIGMEILPSENQAPPEFALTFDTQSADSSNGIVRADAVLLALGGGSWPQTGSDGRWVEVLRRAGIGVSALEPANCGWEVDWPAALRESVEGLPLKNIRLQVGLETATGELLVTRYGLEGGALYQLGAALRAQTCPALTLDLKPAVPWEALVRKLGLIRKNFLQEARSRWKLDPAAFALLVHCAPPGAQESAAALAQAAKSLVLPLKGPRPLAEAISSAGGVRWDELDETLMLRAAPGLFCAGEMIDWEAPTGGYLLQACFATGTRAGRAAAAWLAR